MFPIATFSSFSSWLKTVVNSSGKVVERATRDSPIMVVEYPVTAEIDSAEATTSMPPRTIPKIEATINTILKGDNDFFLWFLNLDRSSRVLPVTAHLYSMTVKIRANVISNNPVKNGGKDIICDTKKITVIASKKNAFL